MSRRSICLAMGHKESRGGGLICLGLTNPTIEAAALFQQTRDMNHEVQTLDFHPFFLFFLKKREGSSLTGTYNSECIQLPREPNELALHWQGWRLLRGCSTKAEFSCKQLINRGILAYYCSHSLSKCELFATWETLYELQIQIPLWSRHLIVEI